MTVKVIDQSIINQSIVTWLRDQASCAGSIVSFDAATSRVWTWGDVQTRVDAYVSRESIQAYIGSKVALFESDSIEFLCKLLGLWSVGARPVLVGDNRTSTQLALADCVQGWEGQWPEHLQSRTVVSKSANAPYPPGVELLTSGSTGQPKHVTKLWPQLRAEVMHLDSLWGEQLAGAAVHASVSHQHIYGLLFRVLWPVLSGRSFCVSTWLNPSELLSYAASPMFASKSAPWVWVASPAHLNRLSDEYLSSDLSLKAVFSSGGPLKPAAAATIELAASSPVLEVLGSTETGGIGWRQPALEIGKSSSSDRSASRGEGLAAAFSAKSITAHALPSPAPWVPFTNVQVKAMDDGRLAIRSPYLATNDWWACDDAVELNENGTFQLLGRMDRVVKVKAKRFSLDQLETSVTGLGSVKHCHAWVERLNNGHEFVAAAVVLNDRGRGLAEEFSNRHVVKCLRQSLSECLDAAIIPRRWGIVDSVPMNGQGKVLLTDLRRIVFADENNHAAPWVLYRQVMGDDLYAELWVPDEHPYFRGHFDRFLVLPGVAHIQWVSHVLEQWLGLSVRSCGLRQLKFVAPVEANTRLSLECTLNRKKPSAKFRFFVEDRTYSQGELLLESTTVL